MARPDAPRREEFSHWVTVSLRYSDQDPLGHVNNVAYGNYFAEGRVALAHELLARGDHPGIDVVLANITIDYRQDMRYPGNVDVGTAIVRVGNKSLALRQGLFKDGKLVATAESVLVFFDTEAGKSVPVPEDVRSQLPG